MICPKCKAKVGIMGSEIILEHGIVNGCRCIICGYWKFDHPQGTVRARAVSGGSRAKEVANGF